MAVTDEFVEVEATNGSGWTRYFGSTGRREGEEEGGQGKAASHGLGREIRKGWTERGERRRKGKREEGWIEEMGGQGVLKVLAGRKGKEGKGKSWK